MFYWGDLKILLSFTLVTILIVGNTYNREYTASVSCEKEEILRGECISELSVASYVIAQPETGLPETKNIQPPKAPFIQIFFLGIIFSVMVFNLISYINDKNRLFLLYALYLFLNANFFVYTYGLTERLFFYRNSILSQFMYEAIFLAQYVYLIFLRELLKIERIDHWRKKIHRFSNLILCSLLLIGLIKVFKISSLLFLEDIYTIVNALFVIVTFGILFRKVGYTTKVILTGALLTVVGGFLTIIFSFSDNYANNLSYFLFGFLLELLMFTYAINYRYSKEVREKIRLENENHILELERLSKEKENQMLHGEVDAQSRELATKSIQLSAKEVLISESISQLTDLKTGREYKRRLQKAILTLKSEQSMNSFTEFETYFNKVHPDFYANLAQNYPGLSPNERKICAYLKLNLTTKDIISITGKTENTINVARSRMRKKMGLNKGENLQVIISNIH